MIKTILTFIFSVLFCLSFPFPAYAQDFTINDFDVNIAINKDSSFTVKETISVEFHRPRHGIYREIPYIYTDSFGSTIKTPLKVISVTDSAGSKITSKISREGNIIKIRIGDADKYISGSQTYEIFYKVENAILFFEDHDELYWNVTGNFWEAEIKNTSATVSLAGEKTKEHWTSCYTGRPGSKEAECKDTISGNFVGFNSLRDLAPGEGFTIAYGWDKGIVSPPSSFQKFLWLINLSQNWIFIFPIFSLLIMFNLWRSIGRDPKVREAVTVMYGPPKFNKKPMSPAEVGTLIDETLDQKDITASIVELAVKGYIKIEEINEEGMIFDSKDYYIKKIKDQDETLTPFEKKLFEHLVGSLSGRMVSDLKNSFYVHLPSLKKTLYNDLIEQKVFSVNPENVRDIYIVAGLAVSIISAFLITSVLGDSLGIARSIISGVLTGLPILSFAKHMPAKTRRGSSVYMEVLGFQEFLNRAEKDHLERMKDENLFSKYFPYALALNVADNWAKAFEGIYQQPPEWYVSPTGMRTFNPVGFTHSVNSAMSNLSSAMYSAPRSSGVSSGGGFSGGGSSGGGFGGGGGGSW